VQKIANAVTPAIPTMTDYLYDDARIIEDQNGAAMTQATYVYGNYIDEVLTMDRAAQSFYYHQNALWSVEAVSDSAGAPVERYSYCPDPAQPSCDGYGFATVSDGSGNPSAPNLWGAPHSSVGNPYLFTGRQLDEETGLYFYRARYYDNAKGRFLQRDPNGYVDIYNLYTYVEDKPTLLVDPSGGKTCQLQERPTKDKPAGKPQDFGDTHITYDSKVNNEQNAQNQANIQCRDIFQCVGFCGTQNDGTSQTCCFNVNPTGTAGTKTPGATVPGQPAKPATPATPGITSGSPDGVTPPKPGTPATPATPDAQSTMVTQNVQCTCDCPAVQAHGSSGVPK
jgi:RHS repeat-associated protein